MSTSPLLPHTDNSVPALNEYHLERIRSVLIEAGITSNMLDLPKESAKDHPEGTPNTSFGDAEEEDVIDVEQGGKQKTGRLSRFLRSISSRSKDKSKNYKVADTYALHKDTYNMFLMSQNWSAPFFYSFVTFLNKLVLFGIVLYWIYRPGGFRDEQKEWMNTNGGNLAIVQATQFMLIPVAIGITEELLITMTVLSTTGWHKDFLKVHPQATRLKWWIANSARGLDGLTWLLIITSLMLYATDVLNMFLNFAALQFLQCIDNVAYQLASEGYLSSTFEKVTNDVEDAKMKTVRNSRRDYVDSVILGLVFSLMVNAWAVVNFRDNGNYGR